MSYILGWLATYYFKSLIVIFITLGALLMSKLGEDSDLFNISICFILFQFAATNQTFALSTFFNNPKLAGQIGTFIMTVASLLYFGVFFQSDSDDGQDEARNLFENDGQNLGVRTKAKQTIFWYLICLIPQPAISIAVMANT